MLTKLGFCVEFGIGWFQTEKVCFLSIANSVLTKGGDGILLSCPSLLAVHSMEFHMFGVRHPLWYPYLGSFASRTIIVVRL